MWRLRLLPSTRVGMDANGACSRSCASGCLVKGCNQAATWRGQPTAPARWREVEALEHSSRRHGAVPSPDAYMNYAWRASRPTRSCVKPAHMHASAGVASEMGQEQTLAPGLARGEAQGASKPHVNLHHPPARAAHESASRVRDAAVGIHKRPTGSSRPLGL